MSLDVYLTFNRPPSDEPRQAIFVRRDGGNVEITREEWDELNPGVEPAIATVNASAERDEVFSANITHNLNRMASEAGIYQHLWCPEEIGISHANQLVGPLSTGLALLHSDPDRFRAFNPDNGWGTYEGLVRFVGDYLRACREYPDAAVSVWR